MGVRSWVVGAIALAAVGCEGGEIGEPVAPGADAAPGRDLGVALDLGVPLDLGVAIDLGVALDLGVDLGVRESDTGVPDDSGVPEDTGVADPDTGVPDPDTGVPDPEDTGVPEDTGIPDPQDTGVPEDTGVPGDTGVPEDTGVAADTGVPPDSGFPPDTGVVLFDAGNRDATIDAGIDAGRDAGVDVGIDAGVDAGIDAGVDAGIDAGRDSGIDAGIDAGRDVGVDVGIDAGVDAGIDAGRDAGIDAGIDAGRDLGVDAGIDAGVDAGIDAGRDAGAGDAVVPAAPDLTLGLSSPSPTPAPINALVTITLAYQNVGTGPAGNVTLATEVPVGTTFDAASSTPGWTCANNAVARTPCFLALAGNLNAGASGTATLALRVISAVGTISATAQIAHTIGTADPNLANNEALLDLRATDVTTTLTLGQETVLATPIGPDRTALYTNEPPGTPPNIANLVVPTGFTGDHEIPLVIMLHGLDGSANALSAAFGHRFATFSTTLDYFVLLPNGTLGPNNRRHWNATDACCDFEAGNPNRDDVGYLEDLIIEAEQKYRVDPTRVYVIGFSNGGFMAYRLACEIPDMIAAIVPWSAATFQVEASCVSALPISVLHIHGTADAAVPFYDFNYDHDMNAATPPILDRPDLPGAQQSLSRFADKANCNIGSMIAGPNINVWHPHPRTSPPNPPFTIGTGDETITRDFGACDPPYQFRLWESTHATHALWIEYDINLISDGIYPNERIYNWMILHQR